MRPSLSNLLCCSRLKFCRAYAWVLLGFVPACGDPIGTHWHAEQRWASTHFVYHARPEDQSVGSEVLDYLEQNAELIAHAQLGIEPAAWGPVDYFKYRDADDFAENAPCGQREHGKENVIACNAHYESGLIELHTAAAVDGHELVHTYAFSLGDPSTFLQEGLAVALSCQPGVETIPFDTRNGRIELPSWTGLVDRGAFEDPYTYVARGTFVAWLIDHVGIQPLLDIYKETSRAGSATDLASSFQAHTNASLDALWEAASSEPLRRTCMSVSPCSALDAEANALARTYPAVPISPTGVLVTSSATGAFRGSPPAVHVCDGAAGSTRDLGWPLHISTPVTTAILLPGNDRNVLTSSSNAYDAWDHGPVPAPDYQAMPLEPSAIGAECESTSAAISFADTQVGLQIGPHDGPLVFQLQSATGAGDEHGYVQAYASGSQSEFFVDVCSACVAGRLEDCQSIQQPGGTTTFEGNAPWIRVRWSPDTNALLTVIARF